MNSEPSASSSSTESLSSHITSRISLGYTSVSDSSLILPPEENESIFRKENSNSINESGAIEEQKEIIKKEYSENAEDAVEQYELFLDLRNKERTQLLVMTMFFLLFTILWILFNAALGYLVIYWSTSSSQVIPWPTALYWVFLAPVLVINLSTCFIGIISMSIPFNPTLLSFVSPFYFFFSFFFFLFY